MIRNKDKIFGEPNDLNTVLATGTLTDGQMVIGAGNKGVKILNLSSNAIIYTNNMGKISSLSFSGQDNKFVGTNSAGQLVLKGENFITIQQADTNTQESTGLSAGVLTSGTFENVSNRYYRLSRSDLTPFNTVRFKLSNSISLASGYTRLVGAIILHNAQIKDIYLCKKGTTFDDYKDYGNYIKLNDETSDGYFDRRSLTFGSNQYDYIYVELKIGATAIVLSGQFILRGIE